MRSKTKSENTPNQTTITEGETIELRTRYGDLSRGRCWGKCYPGKATPTGDFRWVQKHNGVLYLTEPGYYLVGSSDGFTREARGEFCLQAAPKTMPELMVEQFDPCL